VQKIRLRIILNVKFYILSANVCILTANVCILTENDNFENSSKSLSWGGGGGGGGRVAI
jgi:hypothetical protein